MRPILSLILIAACSGGQATSADEALAEPVATPVQSTQTVRPASTDPIIYDVQAVRSLPHDTGAFTQGLFFANGTLYESTGQIGESVIRRIDMRDGSAAAEVDLPGDIFGEGSTAVDDRIVSLSWRAGQGFVHDLETLEPEGIFDVSGEGWGLTYDTDRDRLVLSDGTPELRFLDPDTYEQTGTLTVTLQGRALPRLNELEYLPVNGGEVWANIWQQDFIVRINAESGTVTGVIDVSTLFPAMNRGDPEDDVPNGIAYEPASERIFMTGKRWPQLFEVEIVERTQ